MGQQPLFSRGGKSEQETVYDRDSATEYYGTAPYGARVGQYVAGHSDPVQEDEIGRAHV